MTNSTLCDRIGSHLKSLYSKIYHVSLLDPTKVSMPIQIKLVLLKNLLQQWIEMVVELWVPVAAIFCQI